MTNSLVEDTARAIDPEIWEYADLGLPMDAWKTAKKGKSLIDAERALSVIKDRLSKDDRELVERLRACRSWPKHNSFPPKPLGPAELANQAADRIISLSAGRD